MIAVLGTEGIKKICSSGADHIILARKACVCLLRKDPRKWPFAIAYSARLAFRFVVSRSGTSLKDVRRTREGIVNLAAKRMISHTFAIESRVRTWFAAVI